MNITAYFYVKFDETHAALLEGSGRVTRDDLLDSLICLGGTLLSATSHVPNKTNICKS